MLHGRFFRNNSIFCPAILPILPQPSLPLHLVARLSNYRPLKLTVECWVLDLVVTGSVCEKHVDLFKWDACIVSLSLAVTEKI